MKLFTILVSAVVALLMIGGTAYAGSIVIKEVPGTRTEVTPGPKLPDTVIPGTPATPDTTINLRSNSKPNNVSDRCMTSVMFVSPGDAPGTKYAGINKDDNCNDFVLSEPMFGTFVPGTPGTPDQVIDNGYGPDVTTIIPTCTRTSLHTSRPFIRTSTSDGAC